MTVTAQTIEPPLLRMTEEEFVAWCDEDTRAEFDEGEVVLMSPESQRDENVRWLLGSVMRTFVEERGAGEVYGPNLQIRLRPGVRRLPDLMFVRTDRLGAFSATHFEGAPDLIVEIVSPDSAGRDWHDKYEEYAEAGVREYWIVDPQSKRFDVYVLGDGGRYEPLLLTEGAYHSTVVPGFFIRPEWLWQDPLPKQLDLLRELKIIGETGPDA